MVQVKISQLMFAASVAAAALVGFGGIADAAPAADAPACAEGVLTTVVDDSGVTHEACVESAVVVSPVAVPPALESSAYSIGPVASGCALCYLDFRFDDRQWRRDHPQLARWHATFAGRASVRATEPIDDS